MQLTGNQCNSFKIGVTQDDLLEFVIILDAQFWTFCRHEIVFWLIPVNKLLAKSILDVPMALTRVLVESLSRHMDLRKKT